MKIAMFDSKQYDIDSFEALKSEDIKIKYFETKLTEDTAYLAKGYDAVVVFVNDTVNSAVIDVLKSLDVKLIALRCAGFNNVNLKYAADKIKVIHVPAYSPEAVAEHAIGMLLTSVRRIHKAYIRSKDFNFSLNGLTGFNLCGKTIGVIGTGKIGKAFVNICKGFGMKVLAYDLYPDEKLGIEYTDIDTIFKKSDIISLHCPLTKENYHLIDDKALSGMKDGVVLINTSRGSLIDAEALLEGIKTRKVGAACLDVYEEESDLFFEDNSGHIVHDDILARLISMPNVLITSHQAFLTKEALENIAETTISGIENYFKNGILQNEVAYVKK
ncbi:MAG: 2-hydroxyacid dehydrogenase [Peptococcaceae bacterium]|nr:2-hydroxyacid dehydrogenase [Peptococcaceae bacterium]